LSSKGVAFFCGLVFLGVVSCEFKPALLNDPTTNQMVNATKIEVSGNYKPKDFEEVLRIRFGNSTENAAYSLVVQFDYSDEVGVIAGSGGINRYRVLATANSEFRNLETGEILGVFAITDQASWTADAVRGLDPTKKDINAQLGTGEVLTNLNARDEAQYRLYKMLADRIYTRILAIKSSSPA